MAVTAPTRRKVWSLWVLRTYFREPLFIGDFDTLRDATISARTIRLGAFLPNINIPGENPKWVAKIDTPVETLIAERWVDA